MCRCPGKVHADDIPVLVRGAGSGKTWTAPAGGSTSAMTVTPVHRCPWRSVCVQSGPERYPSTKITPPVTAVCVSGRCLRWLPGVIRIRQNNGSRVWLMPGEKSTMYARAPTHITTEALQRIGGELGRHRGRGPGCSAEQRLAARKARAAPLMQSLYDGIQQQMKTLSRHQIRQKRSHTC